MRGALGELMRGLVSGVLSLRLHILTIMLPACERVAMACMRAIAESGKREKWWSRPAQAEGSTNHRIQGGSWKGGLPAVLWRSARHGKGGNRA